jgi:hypothetical protein
MFISSCFLGAIVLLGLTPLAEPLNDIQKIEKIEARVLQARRQIKHGKIVIEVRCIKFPQNAEYESLLQVFTLVFDPVRTRWEWKALSPSGKVEYFMKHVLTPKRAIKYTPVSIEVGSPGKDERRRMQLFDPRVLGLAPAPLDILYGYGMEDYLLRPDRKLVSYEDAKEGGVDCKKAVFSFSPGAMAWKVSLWYSIPEGGNVRRIESERLINKTLNKWQLSTDLSVLKQPAGWFPKRLHFRRFEGRNLVDEQTMEVKFVDFDSPVGDSSFNISTLGIPEGSRVIEDFRPKTYSGGRLVDASSVDLTKAPLRRGPKGIGIRLSVAAILLLVAAVILFSRYLRARPR